MKNSYLAGWSPLRVVEPIGEKSFFNQLATSTVGVNMFVNGSGYCVNVDEKGFEIPKLSYINIARE